VFLSARVHSLPRVFNAAAANMQMATRVTRAQLRASRARLLGGVLLGELSIDIVGKIVDHLGIKEILHLCATSKEMRDSIKKEIVNRRMWTKTIKMLHALLIDCNSLIDKYEMPVGMSLATLPHWMVNNPLIDACEAMHVARRTMIYVFTIVKDTLPKVDQLKFAGVKSLTQEAYEINWAQVPSYKSQKESNVAETILTKELQAVELQSEKLWDAVLTM